MEEVEALLSVVPNDSATVNDFASGLLAGGSLAFLAGYSVVVGVIGIAVYIYFAIALMAIASKLKVPNGWLAFIPIGNLYLLTQIAGVPWWSLFAFVLSFIPVIGPIAILAVTIWWFWKICERLGKEGWWGIVIALIPIANLILIGMLAWGETGVKSAKPAAAQTA